MRRTLSSLITLLGASAALAVEPTIDGTSAERWQPCTGWVKDHPATYGVTNEGGVLAFRADGAKTEMAWIIDVAPFGVTGDERYVVVRYRATGMTTDPGVYFLHGEEGSHGGRNYARANALEADGKWHALAVDLVMIEPLEATRHLAIKVSVSGGDSARLDIEEIRFADELPKGARVAPIPPRPPMRAVAVDWRRAQKVDPRPGWTRSAATDFGATLDGGAMTFTVAGSGKGMRWLLALPGPVDLAGLPHLSLRYRLTGQPDPTTYVIWLGDKESGTGGNATIPIVAGDLRPDDAWHETSVKMVQTFQATHLAIGLDCAGPGARLTLDTLHFSSRPRRWGLSKLLNYKRRDEPWPAGRGGFVAGPAHTTGGRPSPFFMQRLHVTDWFDASRVTVAGVPFVVHQEVGELAQTSMGGFGALSLKLPAGVREVYLLTAAAAPSTEPWGINWRRPKPQETLDVPEKVFYEVHYGAGPPDRVLPLDAATGRWGMKRGLSVSVVHPDPTRRATHLLLHDRMQTASFAVVGATMRTETPRIPEPNWDHLSSGLASTTARPSIPEARPARPDEPMVTAGGLRARFLRGKGLGWAELGVAGAEGRLACAPGPLFRVSVAGRALPDEDWTFEGMDAVGAGRRFRLRNRAALLTAAVSCMPGKGGQLLLRLSLTNGGGTAMTATVHFPLLRGLRMGSAADTWYLCGKRGGIINSANASFREPAGERHPLQMDGFFNPRTGFALACLTHDTAAQHHFVHLSKNDDGGDWSIEYAERDLPPGTTFTTTEVALVLRPGDWRAILAAYTDWMRTWFEPAAPRKPWFTRSFAMASGNVHYDACPDPRERGAVTPLVDTMRQYIGPCDYVHLFGWGASKAYGEWGDYSHYEEAGGLEYFRGNIRAVQERGIAVSLYLDAYLSSKKGTHVGARALDWAMKRPDGSPQYIKQYDAYNQCPYMKGWQEHLSRTYRRVRDDLGPKILYIDEYGSTDGRWTCHAKDHGHNGYEIPYAGEVAMLARIRQAVGPDVALYTEYPPAEVSRRYLDGSITYQALWSADQESLAPHFIDLARFAFPDFKQLHIIYYVPTRAGNWWLLKFPFFNGEVYRIGVPNLPGMDGPSLAFLKRAVRIQCAHRDAFASRHVQPLAPTQVAGVFANRFAELHENVWTLYNANGRSVRGPVLRVEHVEGATYVDEWNGRPLAPKVQDGRALVSLELGPKGVGCLVQRLP